MISKLAAYVASHIKAVQNIDDEGATMVEYGIMVASIAVVVGASALALGGRVDGLFDGLVV
jgi:pilus assembly protein Flp/PilA